jgi:hypothetical protein
MRQHLRGIVYRFEEDTSLMAPEKDFSKETYHVSSKLETIQHVKQLVKHVYKLCLQASVINTYRNVQLPNLGVLFPEEGFC